MYLDTLDDLFVNADFSITRTTDGRVTIAGTNRMTGRDFHSTGEFLDEAVSDAVDTVVHETWFVQDILDEYHISLADLRTLIGTAAEDDLADEALHDAWQRGFDAGMASGWREGYEAGRADESYWASDPDAWLLDDDKWWSDEDDSAEVEAEIEAANAYEAWVMSKGINVMPIEVAAAQSFDDEWWFDIDERDITAGR